MVSKAVGAPFALDQRIRDQGRAVKQGSALSGFNRTVLEQGAQSVFDGETRIPWCRQGFANDGGAVLPHQKQICESSADIDADAVHGKSVQGSEFKVQG